MHVGVHVFCGREMYPARWAMANICIETSRSMPMSNGWKRSQKLGSLLSVSSRRAGMIASSREEYAADNLLSISHGLGVAEQVPIRVDGLNFMCRSSTCSPRRSSAASPRRAVTSTVLSLMAPSRSAFGALLMLTYNAPAPPRQLNALLGVASPSFALCMACTSTISRRL